MAKRMKFQKSEGKLSSKLLKNFKDLSQPTKLGLEPANFLAPGVALAREVV